jgi:hypothetical protein
MGAGNVMQIMDFAGTSAIHTLNDIGDASFSGHVRANPNWGFKLQDTVNGDRGSLFYEAATGYIRIRNMFAPASDLCLDAGGRVGAGIGLMCKEGMVGATTGSTYNFSWASALYGWVDSTNLGYLTFTSDYRLKDNIAPLPSMWDIVKALNPISYTHKDFTPPSGAARAAETGQPFIEADNIERWGFIAHELQETLIPSAASAVKDAPDAIQSLNLATILSATVKALQEAMARIEALEAGAL